MNTRRIHRDSREPRNAFGSERDERAGRPVRQREAACTTGAAEHEGFGEELPDEPRAARAERGAHGNFARAPARARKQQVGDIHARDQQHERNGGEHHEERRTDVVHDPVVQQRQAYHAIAVRGRIVARQTIGDDGHRVGRCPQIDARLQTGDDAEPLRAALRVAEVLGCEHQRPPVIGPIGKRDVGRCDADHRIRFAIQADGGSDRVDARAELSSPETIADDENLSARGNIGLRERAAKDRHTENGEERRRDVGA